MEIYIYDIIYIYIYIYMISALKRGDCTPGQAPAYMISALKRGDCTPGQAPAWPGGAGRRQPVPGSAARGPSVARLGKRTAGQDGFSRFLDPTDVKTAVGVVVRRRPSAAGPRRRCGPLRAPLVAGSAMAFAAHARPSRSRLNRLDRSARAQVAVRFSTRRSPQTEAGFPASGFPASPPAPGSARAKAAGHVPGQLAQGFPCSAPPAAQRDSGCASGISLLRAGLSLSIII